MRYGSVCSGIEAATAAWHPLGWQPAWFSEIEGFPSAVLAHHYPNVPNLGDMTKFQEWPDAAIDVLVGGTPCQSFSVAGLRKGLADPRGNLMLTFGAIAGRYRPTWLVWENVPGVLSSNGGRDFGTFLGMLAELGYGFAYRVLDAQFFGVAQRRRRVFVVGHLGDWRRAAAVLFERASLRGDPAPSRESRQGTAGSTGDGLARCLTTGEAKRQDWETCNFVAMTFPRQMGASHTPSIDEDMCGSLVKNQTMAVTYSIAPDTCNKPGGTDDIYVNEIEVSRTLDCTGADPSRKQGGSAVVQAVAIRESGQGYWMQDDIAGTIDASMGGSGSTRTRAAAIQSGMAVRRLTPRECERLQGFPDDYTAIPYRGKPADQCPDGPRYKALGNSMAVPVMAWIGRRIQMVSEIVREEAA